jgi:hypothetical protein
MYPNVSLSYGIVLYFFKFNGELKFILRESPFSDNMRGAKSPVLASSVLLPACQVL